MSRSSTWEDLIDWRRLPSTIGPAPVNWFRLQEVDSRHPPLGGAARVPRRVGCLDEAFRPTEWDEADLAYRIRQAGWRVATYGYERAWRLRAPREHDDGCSSCYKARVLRNGRLFHERWDPTIRSTPIAAAACGAGGRAPRGGSGRRRRRQARSSRASRGTR